MKVEGGGGGLHIKESGLYLLHELEQLDGEGSCTNKLVFGRV